MAVRENSPPLLQSKFRCFFPSLLLTFSTNAKSNSISSSTFGRFPVTFMKFHFSVRARVCVCVYIGSIRAERRRYLRGVRSFSSFYSLNGRISGCFNLLSKKQRRGYKCMNENWKIRSKILGLFHRASSISNSARNSAVAL